jgi:hypothetical protein
MYCRINQKSAKKDIKMQKAQKDGMNTRDFIFIVMKDYYWQVTGWECFAKKNIINSPEYRLTYQIHSMLTGR